MEVRKGYKQTEVGVIPEDWVIVRIGDLLNGFQNGYAFSAKEYISVGMPIITMAQIGLDGTFQFSETSVNKWEIEKAKKLKDYFVSDGDVIISMTDVTPSKNLIGRMAITKLETPALLNQRVGLLRLNREKIVSGYLVPLSNQKIWRNYCKAVSSLGVQTNIGTKDIKNGYIPLPSTKVEQEAIAEALSDADALIESLEKLIAKKRDIKQGAMQQLLTGKKRLPAFSGKWETKKLGDVGKCIRGVSYNGERDLSLHDTDTTVRLFRANNVQNGTIDLNGLQYVNNERVKPIQHLQEKDIVICMANGSKQLVGKSAIFNVSDNHKYTFGAFMGCFRTDPNQAVNNFIAFALQTYQYRFFIAILLSGSSINNLKPSDIESIEIPYPKTEEQTAIAAILSDMDAEIKELEQKRDKCKAVKQGMMQELLTGKIRLV